MGAFLKWAGGKARLAPLIVERVAQSGPDTFTRYHEPFLGGGAVFFALREAGLIREASLGDSNPDLITAYTAIRDDVEGVIAALKHLKREYLRDTSEREAFYYEVRDRYGPRSTVRKAARLIFLNKTCYNGLYRVNGQGGFNVPHGRHRNPRILDASGLREASAALACAEIEEIEFAQACARAQPGDLVYLDPPYQPLTETANFTNYTRRGFGSEEQRRLRDAFDDLTARGIPALLSNSDHPAVRELYERYEVAEVAMGRNINSKATERAPINELLISNGPAMARFR